MSATPEETPEVENPDAEPETPIEGGDDEEEAAEEEQTTKQAADAEGSADLLKKADKENVRYHKALDRILGEDENRHDCAACNGLGVTWGEPEVAPEMVHPENLVECKACNGYGQIITGSRAPDHVLAMCTTCAGNGFITKPVVPENLYTLAPPPITAQQAQHGQMMPDGTFVPYGGNAGTVNPTYNPA